MRPCLHVHSGPKSMQSISFVEWGRFGSADDILWQGLFQGSGCWRHNPFSPLRLRLRFLIASDPLQQPGLEPYLPADPLEDAGATSWLLLHRLHETNSVIAVYGYVALLSHIACTRSLAPVCWENVGCSFHWCGSARSPRSNDVSFNFILPLTSGLIPVVRVYSRMSMC